MRFLHTADWHLGRSFHQVGLLPAQSRVLDHLVETVRSERVDAVLVSGDVYDRALPPPDAVTLLGETLTRLVDAGAQVVVSSGNHDSAVRLGFGSSLLERAGVHVRTGVADLGRPVLVGGTAVYPIPYLEPAAVADALGAQERTHAGVLRAAARQVEADRVERGGRSVVMAHAFVTGSTTSDSERDISVGGVSAVPVSVFGDPDYVALGHLHRAQEVGASARYSGSPVAMSFSEAGHTKGSWLVDLSPDGTVSADLVEAPVERPLAVLRGDLDDLLTSAEHAAAERCWVQVTLTDTVRPLGAMDQLRRRFPHTLLLDFDPQGAAAPLRSYRARVASRAPLDVCCDFTAHVRGGATATEAERRLFAEAVEQSRLGRAASEDSGSGRRRASGVA